MQTVIITCSTVDGTVLDSTRVEVPDDIQSLAIVPRKTGYVIPNDIGELEIGAKDA